MDVRGQERAGTRTSPGTPPVDCDRPGETVDTAFNTLGFIDIDSLINSCVGSVKHAFVLVEDLKKEEEI